MTSPGRALDRRGLERRALDRRTPAPGAPTRTQEAEPLGLDAADLLVRDLFDVTLELAACASVSEGPTATRISTAIGRLDDVIRDLRRAALPRNERSGTTPERPAGG